MSHHFDPGRLTRRALLLGGAGAATALAVRGSGGSPGAHPGALGNAQLASGNPLDASLHLAATDGWVSMPPTAPAYPPFWPDPYAANHTPAGLNLFVFGFRNVTGMSDSDVILQKGKAQISAPQLAFDEDTEVRITLSNLGLAQRPDLVDGHTIHWHGFVNAVPLFDGVPELSISVPIGRSFTYFYRPHDAGTYMYHCHFEDVEHVQMGMTGLLFVRPLQNQGAVRLSGQYGNPSTTYKTGQAYSYLSQAPIPKGRYAYNDGVLPGEPGSTAYDREFGLFLTEIFAEGHYRDAHIQTTDWTDFKPSFWLINGRAYPDTLAPNGIAADAAHGGSGYLPDPAAGRLMWQPNSALVTCNEGDKVLLRMSNLGYQNHAMSVDAFDLTVVAKDASLLRNPDPAWTPTTASPYQRYLTNYITTNSVWVGPGESRDVLFTAPANSGKGAYDTYLLYDRALGDLNNGGGAGLGGMVTEIRVYPKGTLPVQTAPNA